METLSSLNKSQPFPTPAKKCLSSVNIADYILFTLIPFLFAIPFVRLFLHYYKFGVLPRTFGLVDFFFRWRGHRNEEARKRAWEAFSHFGVQLIMMEEAAEGKNHGMLPGGGK